VHLIDSRSGTPLVNGQISEPGLEWATPKDRRRGVRA
jgi:hypothetical protein